MGVIPFLKKPTAQEILEYTSIPCYADAKRIILAEIENNNTILLVGDAAFHPSTTHVVIDFADKSRIQYDDMKSGSYGDETYQYVLYSDNNGALQINFGRPVEV